MITQRAWLVGVVGFCFYLIAVVNDLPSFYLALAWLTFAILASSLGIALLSMIGLRAAWRVPHAVVVESAGQAEGGPMVEVQIANSGTLNKTGILIEVLLQRVSQDTNSDVNGGPKIQMMRRFLMEALPSGNSLQTALPLSNLPRGRYRVVELRLIGSDVLGLFRTQKRVLPGVSFSGVLDPQRSTPGLDKRDETSKNPTLVVGPIALSRRDIALSPMQKSRGDGGVPATRFLGQGEDVRGTRLYATGDDLRHVHWKSTARKGQLVVKEFHHTVQEQVLVIWDGAQGNFGETAQFDSTNEHSDAGETGFNSEEWSLRLAASLCRAFLENRRPCALLRLDDAPQSGGLGTDLQTTSIQHGALTMDLVSEILADASAYRTKNFMEAVQPFRARHEAGEVYLVAASIDPEIARAVHQWRAGGARVTVALVNGAAFESVLQSPAFRRAPKTSGAQNLISDEDYQQQARALRSAGARVVLVSPRENSRDFLAPLSGALQELLVPSGSAEAFQNAQNSVIQNSVSRAGVLPTP